MSPEIFLKDEILVLIFLSLKFINGFALYPPFAKSIT